MTGRVSSTTSGNGVDAFVLKLRLALAETRVNKYRSDGLQRLIKAAASNGKVYTYTYDLGGNRLTSRINGGLVQNYSYNAANQVIGFSYDGAGNLLSDGTTTYGYDALNSYHTRHLNLQKKRDTIRRPPMGALRRASHEDEGPAFVLSSSSSSPLTSRLREARPSPARSAPTAPRNTHSDPRCGTGPR